MRKKENDSENDGKFKKFICIRVLFTYVLSLFNTFVVAVQSLNTAEHYVSLVGCAHKRLQLVMLIRSRDRLQTCNSETSKTNLFISKWNTTRYISTVHEPMTHNSLRPDCVYVKWWYHRCTVFHQLHVRAQSRCHCSVSKAFQPDLPGFVHSPRSHPYFSWSWHSFLMFFISSIIIF